jgi:hypothetical protein
VAAQGGRGRGTGLPAGGARERPPRGDQSAHLSLRVAEASRHATDAEAWRQAEARVWLRRADEAEARHQVDVHHSSAAQTETEASRSAVSIPRDRDDA